MASICAKSWREKGTWTWARPSAPATCQRGSSGAGGGGREAPGGLLWERVWELTGEGKGVTGGRGGYKIGLRAGGSGAGGGVSGAGAEVGGAGVEGVGGRGRGIGRRGHQILRGNRESRRLRDGRSWFGPGGWNRGSQDKQDLAGSARGAQGGAKAQRPKGLNIGGLRPFSRSPAVVI